MSKRKHPGKAEPTLPLFSEDLIVLVSDGQMKLFIESLLTKRLKSIGCQPLRFQIIKHPEMDPGCLNRPDGLLASYRNTHQHALVIFDREGCGAEGKSRVELENTVESILNLKGWNSRARAIVIDPELENWIWMRSMHVPIALGWKDEGQSVFEWLFENEFLDSIDHTKPARPKEAVEAVLRWVRKPRSGAIYAQIAEKATLTSCEDPAFLKFRDTLREWFPPIPPV